MLREPQLPNEAAHLVASCSYQGSRNRRRCIHLALSVSVVLMYFRIVNIPVTRTIVQLDICKDRMDAPNCEFAL